MDSSTSPKENTSSEEKLDIGKVDTTSGHTDTKPESNNEKIPPKVLPPDEKEYTEKMNAIDKEIETVGKSIANIVTGINKQRNDKKLNRDNYSELKSKLDGLANERKTALTARNNIQTVLNKYENDRKSANEHLKTLKKNLKYTKLEDVDGEIKKLENRLETTSLPIKTEREVLNNIKQLKTQRTRVVDFLQYKNSIVSDANINKLFDEKKVINDQLNKISDKEEAFKDEKSQFLEKENNINSNIEKLNAEKKVLYKKRNDLEKQEKQLTAEYDRVMREAIRYKRYLAEKKKQERRAQYLAQEEERKKKIEAEKKEEIIDPFIDYKKMISELLIYLDSLEKHSKPAQLDSNINTIDNHFSSVEFGGKPMVALKKETFSVKNDLLDMFPVVDNVPIAKKVKSKKTKENKALKHENERLHCFFDLSIKPPMFWGDIPNTITELKNRLEYFNKQSEQYAIENKTRATETTTDDKTSENKPENKTVPKTETVPKTKTETKYVKVETNSETVPIDNIVSQIVTSAVETSEQKQTSS